MWIWLGALLQTGALLVGCWGLGAWFLNRACRKLHLSLRISAQAALGLLIVSHTVFLLVLAGWISPFFFGALQVVLVAVAFVNPGFRTDFRCLIDQTREGVRRFGAAGLWGLPLLLFGLAALMGSLLPPSKVDDLVYHLEVPRRLLAGGGWVFFPDNVYAYFPQLGEMLSLLGLSLGGEASPRLLHAAAGALAGLALYGFCRQQGMRRGSSLLAPAVLLSVPTVLEETGWAYVDLYFMLYTFLAWVFLNRFSQEESGPEESRRSAVLCGLFAGAAFCVKYTGLQLTLLLVLTYLILHLRSKSRRIPWPAVWIPLLSVLVVSPYLLRNFLSTGWPLFPFPAAGGALDPAVNWDLERGRLFLTWLTSFGASDAGLWDKLTGFIRVFFQWTVEIRSFDGVVGPIFLLIVPLLFLRRSRPLPRVVVTSLIFVAGFAVYWTLSTQQVRFLLPLLPLLAFVLAYLQDRLRSRATMIMLISLLAFNVGLGAGRVLADDPWAFIGGSETRRQYLSRLVPSAPLYQAACQRAGSDGGLFLVNMRNLGYLLTDCDWRADFVFEYYGLEQALRRGTSVQDVADFFASRGVTYLMIDEGVTLSPKALTSRQAALLRAYLQTRAQLVTRNSQVPGQALYRLR